MTDQLIVLSEADRLLLAALVRMMVRQDGILSTAESHAIDWMADQLDDGSGEATGPEGFAALLDRAAERLPDEEAIRAAASAVTDEDAQEDIYGLLFEIAAADTVQASEWHMLEWLAEMWQIQQS